MDVSGSNVGSLTRSLGPMASLIKVVDQTPLSTAKQLIMADVGNNAVP
jgi:hypothetical protein